MTPNEAKEKIRVLLETQREIFFSGGISPNSKLYSDFQKTQDEVLAYFNLEQRPLHYLMLFSYPFQPNHLHNKIAVETQAEFNSMGGKYFLGCYLTTGYPNDLYGCNTLIDKVEHVYWRLSKRAEYLKQKGKY